MVWSISCLTASLSLVSFSSLISSVIVCIVLSKSFPGVDSIIQDGGGGGWSRNSRRLRLLGLACWAANEESLQDYLLVWNLVYCNVNSKKDFFLVGCFMFASESFELVYWGTWHRCLIVEWRNLVTGETLHWL